MLLKNKVITSAALALTMGAVLQLAGCGDGVGAGGKAPTATLAFTSMSALQGNADVSATPFNVTATFSEEVDGFDASDIAGPGTVTVTNFVALSKKEFTFDVTMSTKSGTLTIKKDGAFSSAGAGNAVGSLKLVSFVDDIAPLLTTKLTDGVTTNNSACVYCHSTGTQADRQARIPTLCFGSSSGNLASCSTTTFPKGSTDFTGGAANWAVAIPATVSHTSVVTKVDTVTFDPANVNSKLYSKLSSTGNMPQNSTTAVPATENYRNNPVKVTEAQLENVSNWIKQGAKNN